MDLTLSLTHDCNLSCTYCYAGGKRKQAMSWDIAKTAIDFAATRSATEMQLGFFGGEPLLEWELLQRATEYAEEQPVELKKTVTTNATLLNDDKLGWLAEHAFYPALSIDGNEVMHEITRPLSGGGSSFAACMAGLDATLKYFPDVDVIVVPDPGNIIHMVDGVIFLFEEKKVRRVSINPNFYCEWPDDALEMWRRGFEALGDYYLEKYKADEPIALNFLDGKVITRLKNGFDCHDRCDFGEKSIAVAPSGNIYPCERLVGEDNNDEMCIGNVCTGFVDEKRNALLGCRGNINPDCITCAIKNRCMNWCGCINYATTGAINTTDGIVCFHEQTAVAVADRVGGELYAEGNPAFMARFYYEDFPDKA